MQDIAQLFKDAYLSGRTVIEVCKTLGIPDWKGYEIKQELKLPRTPRWVLAGMPRVFTSKSESIILGTLLGDGSIVKAGNNKNRKLSICHCKEQKQYLKWLREELQELKPSKISSACDKWNTLRFWTPPHPRFDQIYEMCYPFGVKTITEPWLDALTPLSLAIWYMDDGGTQKGAYGCKIATCSFDEQSHERMKTYLQSKWDISVVVKRYKSDNNYPRLYFDSKNACKFKSVIEEHVLDHMKYKFNWK